MLIDTVNHILKKDYNHILEKATNFNGISFSIRLNYLKSIIIRAKNSVLLGRLLKNHIPISCSRTHTLILDMIPPDKLSVISSAKMS